MVDVIVLTVSGRSGSDVADSLSNENLALIVSGVLEFADHLHCFM